MCGKYQISVVISMYMEGTTHVWVLPHMCVFFKIDMAVSWHTNICTDFKYEKDADVTYPKIERRPSTNNSWQLTKLFILMSSVWLNPNMLKTFC